MEQAGTRAHSSGEFRCKKCFYLVMVARGDRIPPCPCGESDYERHVGHAPKHHRARVAAARLRPKKRAA